MTETRQEILERHPGMITVDGAVTWYTPDEFVAARETDWRVEALSEYRNDWLLPIDRDGEEYREIRDYLENNGIPAYTSAVIAEYVRRTGNEVRMTVRYC